MDKTLDELRELLTRLQLEKLDRYRRRVPAGDLLTDRWESARQYGFGEGTSMYDSALVIGDVRVGRNTWIGPNVVLDGSGGLEIGDNCSVAAGVHVYTHDSLEWATGGGTAGMSHAPTRIGSNVYLGPNSVIAKGVTIGDGAVIGALSLVLSDVPAGAKAFGNPARIKRRIGDFVEPWGHAKAESQ
jgi:acetyltransferase-like isoleucine patch superfamily enzyme